jgi:2-oxoisovalerate dehydrogenase E1 component
MKVTLLKLKFDNKKIEVEPSDYKKIDLRLLVNMAFQIFLIREFENTLLKLAGEGCVHGPIHTSIGEEACAAGAMAAILPTDKILSTHRAHHHYLAKVISYYAADGFNLLTDDVPPVMQEEVICLLGEVMGLSIGCCGGRGGSMHLRNAKVGVVGTDALVAGGVPLATGVAFAEKYNQRNIVTVCFLGDGAVNQGSFHESLNLAAVWKLPIVYFIENNLYAVATSIKWTSVLENLSDKASAYGIDACVVDGMNPLAVMLAAKDATEYVRSRNVPFVIEAKCYRYLHHAGSNPGSAYGYRTKDEEKQWQQHDPYIAFPKHLVSYGIISQSQVDLLCAKAVSVVQKAVERCTNLKNGKLSVKEELWPKPDSIQTGLKSDASEFNGVKFNEIEDFPEFETKTYVEAIAAATGRWLEKDRNVFVLGEEVANFGGGPYQATKGLLEKFSGRILNTPISECGFSGLAGGAAMSGLRPIVEIMFPDFALVAADQLFNQIGRLRYMYGNTIDMPLVVRTRIAIGCGYGGQHSMDPTGLYALFSGWRIVAPSNAFDYIGLFNSAMLCKDPVLVMEHHSIYPAKFDVPKNNLDYFVKLGKAKVVRTGTDVTVLCYSSTVGLVRQVAQELEKSGISVEIIDLRTISPADIDYLIIGNSLKKTGVLVTVEQAPASMAIGPRIACCCQQLFFDYLDWPIQTVSALDIPNPVSKKLEDAVVPNIQLVAEVIDKAVKRLA